MTNFMVTFKDSASDDNIQQVKDTIVANGGYIVEVYSMIKGFSFTQPEVSPSSLSDLLSELAVLPFVENIEEDQLIRPPQ